MSIEETTNAKDREMTLNTMVGLRGKLNFDEVVDYVNELIGAKNPVYTAGTDKYDKNIWSHVNNPGQGFGAWLFAHRSIEGVDESKGVWVVKKYNDDYDEVISEEDLNVNIRLELDTAYGYKHPLYEDCAGFHAYIIISLNEYVKERGGSLIWKNEFNGDINEGTTGMEEFLGLGDDAMGWFSDVKNSILKLGS